jgi:putative ATP-dependent DNA ligase
MIPLKKVNNITLDDLKFINYTAVEFLTYKELSYIRIKKNFKGFNYGEVILDNNTILPQYPSIYRCYNLKKAIRNHFQENEYFIVEEKIDGYNIRIIKFNNEIFCFTRGGFICPFTNELINQYPQIKHFLNHNPDKVICAEVIGENPYNTLSIRMYGLKSEIFVFDIMKIKDVYCKSRKKNFLLSTEEKLAYFETYKFKTVPIVGKFTVKDYNALKNIIKEMNSSKKEGIVLKSSENRKKYVKYATPYADIEAITDHISKCFECDTAHFRKRLFLIGSYIVEFGDNKDEIRRLLDEKLMESITKIFKENQKIEVYELSLKLENWIELEKLLSRTLKIKIISQNLLSDGRLRIKFEKYYKKTSEFIKGANAGRLFLD